MSVKSTNYIESTTGFKILNKDNNDIVLAGGSTGRLVEEIQLINDEIRLNPAEVIFSTSTFDVNSSIFDTKLLYLFYDGSDDTSVTLGTGTNKQTVYLFNLSTTGSVVTFFGDFSNKVYHKYYYSEALGTWLFLGQFEFGN